MPMNKVLRCGVRAENDENNNREKRGKIDSSEKQRKAKKDEINK
jgi:hypothetical protein